MHIPTRTTVRLPGRLAQLPTDLPMDKANPMCACSDTQLPTVLQTDIKKSGGIFKILVRISKQYRRKYQRDLMPPPKKILFYFPSVIPSVNLQHKTDPPSVVHFFTAPLISSLLLFSSPLSINLLRFSLYFYCFDCSFQHIKMYDSPLSLYFFFYFFLIMIIFVVFFVLCIVCR